MKSMLLRFVRSVLISLVMSLMLAVSLLAQTPVSPTSPVTINFRDVAADAGLTAINVSGDADSKRYILETTGDGVAIFDYDNDALMDIFLANATTMRSEEHTSELQSR